MVRRINFKILNTCAGTLCIITNGVNLANENHVGWSIAGIYAGIFCIATTQWARQAMANTLRKIADILCA